MPLPHAFERITFSESHEGEEGFGAAVERRARLVEIFADDPRDAAGSAFALALAGARARNGHMLWVQDRVALRDHGRPWPLWRAGAETGGLIHVEARDASQALWAMEEGLRCGDLSAVIGEIAGNPRALDFTASRRLAVASERGGVPAFMLRIAAKADLSGARLRWRVTSAPSAPHEWDDQAPGNPSWALDLFRARGVRPGRWRVTHDRAADRLDLVSAAGDRALGKARSRAA